MTKAGALLLVLGVCVTGCATGGGVPLPRPFPGAAMPPGAGEAPPVASVPPRAAPRPQASALLGSALALQGVPYVYGGATPDGFDCSGLVQYVFAQQGVTLPRVVQDQYQVGRIVNRQQIRPGDLIFFQTVSPGASHVGIVIGDDQFVHAPSSRGVVRVESYTTPYWAKRYVGARRIDVADAD